MSPDQKEALHSTALALWIAEAADRVIEPVGRLRCLIAEL